MAELHQRLISARIHSSQQMSADKALDLIERAVVTGLYCFLFARLVWVMKTNAGMWNVLPLLSEGLVVVFLLARRPSRHLTHRPAEWLLAFGATCAPLLVRPNAVAPLVLPQAAALIWLVGMIVQLIAKVTLGRSFGLIPAHRGLKIAGPYRFVRHPMYFGYLLTHIGYVLIYPSLWNFSVYSVCYLLQVPRLLAEERLMMRDPAYCAYSARVRYRLMPGVF